MDSGKNGYIFIDILHRSLSNSEMNLEVNSMNTELLIKLILDRKFLWHTSKKSYQNRENARRHGEEIVGTMDVETLYFYPKLLYINNDFLHMTYGRLKVN